MFRARIDRFLVRLVAHLSDQLRPHLERTVVDQVILDAVRDSADYANERMQGALYFRRRDRLLDFALTQIAIDDAIVAEFGVSGGESINYLARKLRGRVESVYGFDSFEGLKEDWRGGPKARGAFSKGGILPKVEPNVRLVKGWFDSTLPTFLDQNPKPFAFIHVDSDTYEAAKEICTLLDERMTRGTIIVFDEYFGYRGWRLGEWKAWQEHVSRKNRSYEYLAFSVAQVAIRIL
jgi:predicted O-methyltransferase YrrM